MKDARKLVGIVYDIDSRAAVAIGLMAARYASTGLKISEVTWYENDYSAISEWLAGRELTDISQLSQESDLENFSSAMRSIDECYEAASVLDGLNPFANTAKEHLRHCIRNAANVRAGGDCDEVSPYFMEPEWSADFRSQMMRDWREGHRRERHIMHGMAMCELYPLKVPSSDDLVEQPGGIQVAWDAVADSPLARHSIRDLLRSHYRAKRLGLEWKDPVQRAIAERCEDQEPKILKILEGGAR